MTNPKCNSTPEIGSIHSFCGTECIVTGSFNPSATEILRWRSHHHSKQSVLSTHQVSFKRFSRKWSSSLFFRFDYFQVARESSCTGQPVCYEYFLLPYLYVQFVRNKYKAFFRIKLILVKRGVRR